GRADDAFAQLEAQHLAARIDFHHAGEHQAVHVRPQAAHVGGEFDRQHRHRPVGEIDGRAAHARFQVQRSSVTHVVRHVGNVHMQLEVAVGQAVGGDGVVEVARGLAVNGDDGKGAEVATGAQLGRGNDVLDRLRFFQNLGGKPVRQVVLADDDLHVNAEIVFVTEDFH